MSRPAESSKRLIHNSRGNHSDSGATKPERLKTRISGTDGFSLGRQEIDLRYTEQLIDAEQTAALGLLLKYAVEHLADGRRTLPEIVQFLWKNLSLHGLSFFTENQKFPVVTLLPVFRKFMPVLIVTEVYKKEFCFSDIIKSPLLRRSCRLSGDSRSFYTFRERKDFLLRYVISLRCKYHNL